MTDMKLYSNDSFEQIYDKGALDALMSTNTNDTKIKAKKMFNEIERMLIDNGKYICITLAENYIFETLLSYFRGNDTNCNWSISVEIIDNIKESPFQAFFIILTKFSKISINNNNDSNFIDFYVDSLGNRISIPQTISTGIAIKTVLSIQEFHQKTFELGTIKYFIIIIIIIIIIETNNYFY
jgi:hypothetical protein